jgi:hypothetical protein
MGRGALLMNYDIEPYRQEILARPIGPTKTEQRALALQARYNIECDQFDDVVLTGQRNGEPWPASEIQRQMMINFSKTQLKILLADAKKWGVSRKDLRHARECLLVYGREGMEETYERFRRTIEAESLR